MGDCVGGEDDSFSGVKAPGVVGCFLFKFGVPGRVGGDQVWAVAEGIRVFGGEALQQGILLAGDERAAVADGDGLPLCCFLIDVGLDGYTQQGGVGAALGFGQAVPGQPVPWYCLVPLFLWCCQPGRQVPVGDGGQEMFCEGFGPYFGIGGLGGAVCYCCPEQGAVTEEYMVETVLVVQTGSLPLWGPRCAGR